MREGYSIFETMQICRHDEGWAAIAVRLVGRKRWGVRIAPIAEWQSVERGDPKPDGRSFGVVKNSLSRALRIAAGRMPQLPNGYPTGWRSKFHLITDRDEGVVWSRVGEKFRWLSLGHELSHDDDADKMREYARRTFDRGAGALKG